MHTFGALDTLNFWTGENHFAATFHTAITDSALSPGNCVQADTGGLLTTAASPCGSGSGGGTSSGPFPLENCTTDQTGATFPTVATLTNYFFAHWEFAFNPAGFPIYLDCTVRMPHTLPATGAAKLVLGPLAANDATANHSMTFATCDILVGATVNVGSLTCAPTQTFLTTTTAYAPATLTFAVQATPAADAVLVVQVKATAESGLATNVLLGGAYLEWQ